MSNRHTHVHRESIWPRPPPTSTQSRDNTSYRGTSIYDYSSPYLAHRDEDLLTRAMSDCGLHAFGTVFSEVWVASTDGTRIIRPAGGHWMDSAFSSSLPTEELRQQAKEIDEDAPDCAIGEGLAGTLFHEMGPLWVQTAMDRVFWRELASVVNDPFIQLGSDERMRQLSDLGIGIVAVSSFSFQRRKGIVLFMSRATANINMLKSKENENYITGSADLIGAAFAIRIARMEASRIRQEQKDSGVDKLKTSVFGSIISQAAANSELKKGKRWTTSPLLELEDGNAPTNSTTKPQDCKEENVPDDWKRPPPLFVPYCILTSLTYVFSSAVQVAKSSVLKWKGSGLRGVKRQNLIECAIAWFGVFMTMLALIKMDNTLMDKSGDIWTYDPGWWSSTLCIVFALTSAPVGQPFQIVMSHLWCALIGLACQQIPHSDIEDFFDFHRESREDREGMVLPQSWKEAIAVASAIAGMAFMGIMHPPSSGLAYTFSKNPRWGASNVILILLGDCIVIFCSVLYLNLFSYKQYPNYWIGHNWRRSICWRSWEELKNKRYERRLEQDL